MADIGVILAGVGAVGQNLTRLLSARPGLRLAAAYTRNPRFAGRDLGLHSGTGPIGVEITTDRGAALEQDADLLLVATTSFLKVVAGDLRAGIDRGLNAVTTAEEASFPWLVDEHLARELDGRARDRGVSILGAGLNPGFVFDALLLTASGIAWDVNRIGLRRVVDVSGFSATVQRRLGIGFSKEEFEAGVEAGTIRGHIGFPQSFSLAARCLGRSLERIDKSFEPLIAAHSLGNERLRVEAGTTGGFVQRVSGFGAGHPWIEAEFIAHVDPPGVGLASRDSISIEGHNPINLSIDPGCNPQLGTAGMLANCIPRVIQAKPGFITVADLAVPHARPTRREGWF